MKQKYLIWLYKELPKLVSFKAITSETAESIRNYYGTIEKRSFSQILLTVFSVLGALLIGFGIILLFAYNWHSLPRWTRTILSLLPLIIAQGLVYYTWKTKEASPVWTEGSSAFLTLMIGSAIALISQTYHITSLSMADFFLLWLVLTIPILWFQEAVTAFFLFFIGLCFWTFFSYDEYNNAFLFWILLGSVIPLYIKKMKTNPFASSTVFISWFLMITLGYALALTLCSYFEDSWLLIFSAYFSLLYLCGRIWFNEAPFFVQRPFHSVGTAGIILFSFLLTYEWFWEEIRHPDLFQAKNNSGLENLINYSLAAMISFAPLFLVFQSFRKKQYANLLFGLYYFMVLLAYLLISQSDDYIPLVRSLFNIYLFIMSIIIMKTGADRKRLGLLNGGVLIMAVLIFIRFVVSDLGLITRGLIFISIGIGFFLANYLFSKKLKGEKA